MFQAYANIVREESGLMGLWSGTPSRTIEATKRSVLSMGGSPTLAALAGGTVGGVAQAIVMTPAGMIFTSLNVNRGQPGH
ncbi:MAG: hypothetical protein SGBAC_004951 [Bacillariaceae sp.]